MIFMKFNARIKSLAEWQKNKLSNDNSRLNKNGKLIFKFLL